MKRIAVLFVQMVIVLTGVGAAAVLLWEPQIEGRNAHATFVQVYFNDTFLAYAYLVSIPFFVALTQAFRLFGDAGRKAISQQSVGSLRIIKYCAFAVIACVMAAEAYLVIVMSGQDDIAGGVAMGLLVTALCAAIATAAALFERTVQTRFLGATP